MVVIASRWFVLVCALIVVLFSTVSFITAPRLNELMEAKGSDKYEYLSSQRRLFHIDEEVNIPTWFVSFLCLYAGFLASLISLSERNRKTGNGWYWCGIAVVFSYLSLDEVAGLHELLIEPLRYAYDLPSWLYQSWIIVGMALVAMFIVVYGRFWWNLPTTVRNFFALATIVYVGGSVGVEAIGGHSLSTIGLSDWYIELSHIEEFLEMMGIILALYAVTEYARLMVRSVTIRFGMER